MLNVVYNRCLSLHVYITRRTEQMFLIAQWSLHTFPPHFSTILFHIICFSCFCAHLYVLFNVYNEWCGPIKNPLAHNMCIPSVTVHK